MSVIAKMNCFGVRQFGEERLVEMNCVYDGDLAHKDNENYRFTQASPSGDCKLHAAGAPFKVPDEYYLIISRGSRADVPDFEGAIAATNLRVQSVTDYGGTSKRVEIFGDYSKSPDIPTPLRISALNMQMSIDNPAASVQFEPGKADYWLRIYPASKFTMDEVLSLAR